MKVDDMQRLVKTENNMVRWMSGVTLKNRRSSEELVGVDRVVRRGRLRWFWHVERKEADDWVSKCRNLEVVGGAKKERGRKTWMECVKKDMKECGLKIEDAQNRPLWSTKVNLLVTSNPRFSVEN